MHREIQIESRCANWGCNQPVCYSRGSKDNPIRPRSVCSNCHKASYGAAQLMPGVTAFKQNRCSNEDAHLGFACSMDLTVLPSWAKGYTEIDHKDGNAFDNRRDNLEELCVVCHKLKSIRQGDYRKRKGSAPIQLVSDNHFNRFFECENV